MSDVADSKRASGRWARFAALLRWFGGERLPPTIAVVFLVGGALLCLLGTPAWWFGSAIAVASATSLLVLRRPAIDAFRVRASRPRRVLGIEIAPWPAAIDAIYVLLLVFIASVMMSEIIGGDRPVSHDHTVHYVKAWQLHRHFLPEGRLFGWSQRFFAGYPANYLYPPGADLWVNAVHALCLGLLTFSQSYAIAFWLAHVLTGLAAYRFGRVVGGRHVGFIAALLMLTDLSDFRLGGWAYTVEYGVWPQALSLNFGLLALCHLPALAAGGRLSSLAAFAIWTGLAIITHPAALIFLVIVVVVCGLAAGFADDVKAPGALVRLALASLLSLAIASLWLIPFLSSRAETDVMGVWWDSTYEIGKGLLDLDALPGTLPYVLAFGGLALVVMLRSRRFSLLFCALMALVVPAVSNSTFIDEFHLPELARAFSKIQYVRMSTMVKPFWFTLAAYCAVTVVAAARKLQLRANGAAAEVSGARPLESTLRLAALAWVTSLLVLPFAVPTAEAFWTRHVRKSLTTESDRPLLNDRRDMVEWLEHNLPRNDGFYRLGVFTGHNHDLLDLAAQFDIPIYKRGFTPATNFIYKMKDEDRAIVEAVNVRYVLSKRYEPPELFDLVKTFGIYRVYRFRFWTPNPFQVIAGSGDVTLEKFGDEEVILRAAEGSSGKLRLNVSYFSRWKAYRDGKRIPISLTYLTEAPDSTGFITVKLEPGRYRFAFERTFGDHLAIPLGLSSLAFAFLLLIAGRSPGRWPRLSRGYCALGELGDRLAAPGLRRLRLAALCACAAAFVAIGIALGQWRPPLSTEALGKFEIKRVRFDFLEGLSAAHANIEYPETNQPCLRQGNLHVCRDPLGNLDNERYVASTPANIEEYTMVRCIRARPEADALLSISYPRVRVGDAIVGYYGIERAGRLMRRRRPVEFKIMLDDEVRYEGHTESDNKMHWFEMPIRNVGRKRADVVFTVRASNVNKRYFCFYAQMVDLK